MGHRNWQIESEPRHDPAFRPDSELKLLQEFTASHSWTWGRVTCCICRRATPIMVWLLITA
jgi:hypothetical protein